MRAPTIHAPEHLGGTARGRGWTIKSGGDTDDDVGVPYAYTVGLNREHGAEFVIASVSMAFAEAMVERLIVRCGTEVLAPGIETRRIERFAAGRAVVLRRLPVTIASAFLVEAGPRVAAIQVILPDEGGRLPWEPDAVPGFAAGQCIFVDWRQALMVH